MEDLAKRAYYQLGWKIAVVRAVVIFLSAASLRYWQAWLFIAITLIGDLATVRYQVRHDPELLRRRMQIGPYAEQRADRKRVQMIARLAVSALFVIAARDHRDGWSHVPAEVCLLGDVLVAAGMLIVWVTYRANSFASAIVEVDAAQTVASTGPYALVRHPMYTGLIVMTGGSTLALGSWWGLLGVAVFAGAVVVRLLEEEQFLAHSLSGYTEYRSRVRHRLAPLVW
jgi:protein-S-isoprenylcysteine O-methyltransferase Ste14